ncbi:hypothetical protein XELAEV_18030218mg [Xenopus laevis]|uniref:Uncharacterized protein n=1 Tax=Xenopus laevis TaxID=8355 RepID=A0A974CT48_XENLA|nr:hypothetical protein XELAEV_18030218mg [Xenopus laevis]
MATRCTSTSAETILPTLKIELLQDFFSFSLLEPQSGCPCTRSVRSPRNKVHKKKRFCSSGVSPCAQDAPYNDAEHVTPSLATKKFCSGF